MNTIEHLRELFSYDAWADEQSIRALTQASSGRSLRILAHLLITKQEYFERLSEKDSTGFNFWPDLGVDECRELALSTAANYGDLLASNEEQLLEKVARYKTSEGVPYEHTFRELLTHVLHHSSIHRGNIVLKMREEGLEPPKIDYIIYLRQLARS